MKKITLWTVLALLALSATVPALAQGAADLESAAHANWRGLMKQVPAPDTGCFHASYPSVVWDRVDCTIAPPRAPTHVKPKNGEPEVVGNGNDYAAQGTGLIQSAAGAFATSGVYTEVGFGVPAFHDQGILGFNEYSVQINTNNDMATPFCAGHIGCTVEQQFIYATDYIGTGNAAVFMQYWLINWGSACPNGWYQYGSDCVANSPVVSAPDIPIWELGQVELEASVQELGFDSVTLYYGSEVVKTTWLDIALNISTVWNKAEFNVVGNAGGSQAVFNSGSVITVTLYIDDGLLFSPPPTCLPNAGTTGETNNLILGPCVALPGYGIPPSIMFTEGFPTP